ncbi:MAG TPA: error-prone DNA polymerase [Rhodanobacteraceae bacterium]|nr:error-prone DNA polymerase [Rhodanobacteraceae bacterium]
MATDDFPPYAELHCLSAFSFQRGASVAQELFERAAQLKYTALAITDEASLAGIVRALEASRKTKARLIVGSEVQLADGPKLVLLVETARGYTRLCQLLTLARRRVDKGTYRLLREDLAGAPNDGLLALWIPPASIEAADGAWVKRMFPECAWLAVELHRGPDDAARLAQLRAIGTELDMPLVASGDVHMHVRGRRALQDTLTAIRCKATVDEAGFKLFPNGERHLRTRRALAAIYPAGLLEETVRIAARCTFSLEELHYEYPHELVPQGRTAAGWLRELTEAGARTRWPGGVPGKARALIEHELALISELHYESYFLTVHDLVHFARSEKILCQGRGSAANSAVCYALGITEIDPSRMNMLFERFVSRERNEPPDIDIDFEHERREEVIQYVFRRYGRERAALTAVASTYRGRGAMRDVAKALGLPPDMVDRLARCMDHWGGTQGLDEVLRERGFDPDAPLLRRVLALTAQLIGMPRHLSQHPGGFVMSEHPLSTLVPVENATMEGRTVIQWDKDDLDVLGLLKVDCLALGMLTAIRKTLDLLRAAGRRDITLADIPSEDEAVYEMVGRADTIGVFQIESRAQMAMLPRLQPKSFYDLVIEVAIVRPGPIQGDMVHPYLRRRNGEESIDYPSPALQKVLQRTLGVPLFQEQVMQIAIVAADYSPGEADQLRRSMAAWKRHGGLEPHRERLARGMLAKGYSQAFADHLFEQIKGFGSYGFPESHAASFALITWTSCWLKYHEPAAFACGLINSAPMGFYSPDQLLQDARRHGIRVLPVDVRYSVWNCVLEVADAPSVRKIRHSRENENPSNAAIVAREDHPLRPTPCAQPAIRMGLRMVRGFPEGVTNIIAAQRTQQPFHDVADLCRRAGLDARQRAVLADAGALRGLAGHRHRARWSIAGVEPPAALFADAPAAAETEVTLSLPTRAEDARADYALTGTTLGPHPLSFLRALLTRRRCRRSAELKRCSNGAQVRTAGLVTLRQRPQTASGVIFMTLEDEDGMTNVVVWNDLAHRQRRELLESRLLAVEGKLESRHGVQHLIAERLHDWTALLGELDTRSRDFH